MIDKLSDPQFVPCRDERCPIESLHREHVIKMSRARPYKDCPTCGEQIIRVQGERAHCTACGWRGYFVKEQPKEKQSA